MATERKYGVCECCGNVVYREPGKRHGDGQIDTDAAPVWLYAGPDNCFDGAFHAALRPVNCGCQNEPDLGLFGTGDGYETQSIM